MLTIKGKAYWLLESFPFAAAIGNREQASEFLKRKRLFCLEEIASPLTWSVLNYQPPIHSWIWIWRTSVTSLFSIKSKITSLLVGSMTNFSKVVWSGVWKYGFLVMKPAFAQFFWVHLKAHIFIKRSPGPACLISFSISGSPFSFLIRGGQ